MYNVINTYTGNVELTRKTRKAAEAKAAMLNGSNMLRVSTLKQYVVRQA